MTGAPAEPLLALRQSGAGTKPLASRIALAPEMILDMRVEEGAERLRAAQSLVDAARDP